MKINILKKINIVILTIIGSGSLYAQTAGTLTFTYTPVSHTGYSGTKNALAVWIQSSTGTFIKTRLRYAGAGHGTSDHLPTWGANSGGSATNCLASSCNITGATTGSTLSNFTTKTITWDGTDASGNLVPDGTYKVTIESTWNHGTSGTATRSFTFTKGATADVQTPTADGNFTSIALSWQPSTSAGTNELNAASITVAPNPSTDGIYTITFTKASSLKVLALNGTLIQETVLKEGSTNYNLDLSNQLNGIYLVVIELGSESYTTKVIKGQE